MNFDYTPPGPASDGTPWREWLDQSRANVHRSTEVATADPSTTLPGRFVLAFLSFLTGRRFFDLDAFRVTMADLSAARSTSTVARPSSNKYPVPTFSTWPTPTPGRAVRLDPRSTGLHAVNTGRPPVRFPVPGPINTRPDSGPTVGTRADGMSDRASYLAAWRAWADDLPDLVAPDRTNDDGRLVPSYWRRAGSTDGTARSYKADMGDVGAESGTREAASRRDPATALLAALLAERAHAVATADPRLRDRTDALLAHLWRLDVWGMAVHTETKRQRMVDPRESTGEAAIGWTPAGVWVALSARDRDLTGNRLRETVGKFTAVRGIELPDSTTPGRIPPLPAFTVALNQITAADRGTSRADLAVEAATLWKLWTGRPLDLVRAHRAASPRGPLPKFLDLAASRLDAGPTDLDLDQD